MKRSAIAISLLFAAASVCLLLLLDPFEWLGQQHELEAVSSTVPASERQASGPDRDLVAIAREPGTDGPDSADRRALAPEVGSELVTFRVLDSARNPVAGARVLLARGESVLLDAVTDAAGEVAHVADSKAALLVIAIRSRPPDVREVRLEPGRQDLHLAQGGLVAGRLVEEDGRDLEGLQLRLDFDSVQPSNADVPRIVWETLGVVSQTRAFARAEIAAGGGFEFSGLPPSWSGTLRLPNRWRVTSASEGQFEPSARGVRLARPTGELLLRVVRDMSVRGRLVLRNGEPFARVTLSAMIRSPDSGSPGFSSDRTDEEGRFELHSSHGRIDTLDIRLGGRFNDGLPVLSLEGSAIPADGDLGDVVVDGARIVPFVLQDPAGVPISGGKAMAAGTFSVRTGKDGRSELRGLPRSVDRVRAEAPGFVPVERELRATVVDPLVLTMEHANRLEVRVLPPQGGDPSQFKVVLRRADGLTASIVADQTQQRAHVGGWIYPPVSLMGESHGSYLCSHLHGADGVAEFHALRPGVEIELEVHGITGEMVYHRETLAPLGPVEVRRLDVVLGDEILVFHGRVLDQAGNPLERASLQLGNQILGRTDAAGAFQCFLLDPRPGTLLIQHPACATRYLHDYVMVNDGRPVEFRLSPSRSVEIEVIDEAGAPVPQAEVWIFHGGFTTNTHRVEGHRHVARSVPEGTFEFAARIAGRDYRQEHDSQVQAATIVVPVHGSLVALVSPSTTRTRAGSFRIQLVPEDEAGGSVGASRDSAVDLRIEVPAVYPGTYRASLRYEPSEQEQAAGREPEVSESVPVTVSVGEVTELHIGLTGT